MSTRSVIATCMIVISLSVSTQAEETRFVKVFGPYPEFVEKLGSDQLRMRVFSDTVAELYTIEAGVLKGSNIGMPHDVIKLVKGVENPKFIPSPDKKYFIGKVTPRGVSVYEVFIRLEGGPFDKAIVNMRGSREGVALPYARTKTTLNLFELDAEMEDVAEGPVDFHTLRIFVK